MSNQVAPSIASNDIIFEVTGQDLLDLGYYVDQDEREDIFNLHINISKTKLMYKTKLIFKYTFEKINIMEKQNNTPSIASNDIIIKITGQELIDLGYFMEEDKPEDKFNLHINISKKQIKIAPDVDGADFDNFIKFDYEETMCDLHNSGHIANAVCDGVKYWYNNHSTETSSSCNPCEIAEICELSDDELSAFESLEDLNDFISGDFSFSYEPKY